MKETAVGRAEAQGRHVKQSGGHGQFAVCHLVMEPLPRGTGVEFDEVVVGGAVPRQFIGSVEKGVHHQLEKGLLAGWPVVDVKVTLTDGKSHSVDSSDIAFQTAAGIALRDMASPSTMCLLEPIDTVTVTVDDEHLGAVMTDIGTRRGQIIGSSQADGEPGRSVLEAAVPQLELLDYAISLRSLAHGTGTFHREHRGYEQLPDRLAQEHLGDGLATPDPGDGLVAHAEQAGADLGVPHEERALVEALAAQPRGDLVVALARVARAAGRRDVVERVAPTAGDRQHAVPLQRPGRRRRSTRTRPTPP